MFAACSARWPAPGDLPLPPPPPATSAARLPLLTLCPRNLTVMRTSPRTSHRSTRHLRLLGPTGNGPHHPSSLPRSSPIWGNDVARSAGHPRQAPPVPPSKPTRATRSLSAGRTLPTPACSPLARRSRSRLCAPAASRAGPLGRSPRRSQHRAVTASLPWEDASEAPGSLGSARAGPFPSSPACLASSA